MNDMKKDGQRPRRKLYGRRQGRPLRPSMTRLLAERLPEMGIDLPAEGQELAIADLLPPDRPEIWLEIGFGGGEHLVAQAEQIERSGRPVALLGAEYFKNGVAKLLRGLEPLHRNDGDGVPWIRLFVGDGRDLLAALPAQSLSRVFILFPDPWPKARHHKRRLIQDRMIDQLARVLKDGALLRIATDDPDYLIWIMARMMRRGDFDWLAETAADWRERPDDWPATRYEEKARAAGRVCSFLTFRRVTAA